jgi:hypothetical protein
MKHIFLFHKYHILFCTITVQKVKLCFIYFCHYRNILADVYVMYTMSIFSLVFNNVTTIQNYFYAKKK